MYDRRQISLRFARHAFRLVGTRHRAYACCKRSASLMRINAHRRAPSPEHLAEILSLRYFQVGEFAACCPVSDAIDQIPPRALPNWRAMSSLVVACLDYVMQERGGERLRIRIRMQDAPNAPASGCGCGSPDWRAFGLRAGGGQIESRLHLLATSAGFEIAPISARNAARVVACLDAGQGDFGRMDRRLRGRDRCAPQPGEPGRWQA